jgi:DNA-binding transcriptional regulator YiaG
VIRYGNGLHLFNPAYKGTLQNWEQGRRRPRGPAKALLQVFEKDPKAVVRALG